MEDAWAGDGASAVVATPRTSRDAAAMRARGMMRRVFMQALSRAPEEQTVGGPALLGVRTRTCPTGSPERSTIAGGEDHDLRSIQAIAAAWGCQYAKIGRIGEVAIARPRPSVSHVRPLRGRRSAGCRHRDVHVQVPQRRLYLGDGEALVSSGDAWNRPAASANQSFGRDQPPPARHARPPTQPLSPEPAPDRRVRPFCVSGRRTPCKATSTGAGVHATRRLAAADRARWSTTPRDCSRSTMRRPAQITTCSRVAPCCRSASPTRRGGVEVMHDHRQKPPRAERLHERRDIKAKMVGKFLPGQTSNDTANCRRIGVVSSQSLRKRLCRDRAGLIA